MNKNIQYRSLSYEAVYTKVCEEAHSGAYISYLRGKRCQTDESFFYEISASFQFPYYFGENWSALDDCLQDLSWLCFKRIVIILDDYSLAYAGDAEGKQLMLRHFNYMADYWESRHVVVEVVLNN